LLQLPNGRRGLETMGEAAIYRLRGRLLPVLALQELLQLPPGRPADAPHNLVVVRDGERQFALLVDEISDSREIVVKPLCSGLKSILCFAGATILGDGSVALILDAAGLARRAALVSTLAETPALPRRPLETPSAEGSWLVFRVGPDGRSALPLRQVLRLEEIPATRVERAGGHEVVQYREQLMPLLRLSAASDAATLQVIVHSDGDRAIGLVVDEILDIVDEAPALIALPEAGDSASLAILQQRTTEVLDLARRLGAVS